MYVNAVLSFATQHATPLEFGIKWGTECLNTRFPLRTLLCARYRVKLINLFYFMLPKHEILLRLVIIRNTHCSELSDSLIYITLDTQKRWTVSRGSKGEGLYSTLET